MRQEAAVLDVLNRHLFGQVNLSYGQVENSVKLVRGQVEKIQNYTPLDIGVFSV